MEWLDRALVVSPYHYGLCMSEKDFHKELKKLKVPRETWPSFLGSASANATAHFFEKEDGAKCCIVTMAPSKKHSLAQIYALLTHEAVHIWQAIREDLGEKSPSSEFEAYAIQTLSQMLIQSYENQRKKK